ncbi:protein IQ-DOMAIN 18-like [Impatiens glandulifera]|uniref:protein IQ-DOMAIN 18-like n=1 Tax=Impatiens glandulifera TaxID=253017 RepID=UPI001FB059CA|nr:protein IQ-DOMAIN 18-like [Impatiens glandulifera]
MGRSRKWFKNVKTKMLLCTSHSTHPDETFVVFHTNEASNTPFSQEINVPPKDQKNNSPPEVIIAPTKDQQNNPPTEEIIVVPTKDQQNNPPTEEISVVPTKDQQNNPPPQEIIVMPTNDQKQSNPPEEIIMPPKDQQDNTHQDRAIISSSNDHQIAVIKIQTSFRAHLARRAYKALKGLVKLQAVVRGMCVRRQVQLALNCMNTLARLQITVRSHQLLTESNFPSSSTRSPSATQQTQF